MVVEDEGCGTVLCRLGLDWLWGESSEEERQLVAISSDPAWCGFPCPLFATDNVTTDNVTTDNVTTDNVTTDNVTDNVTTDNVTTDNVTDNVTTDNVTLNGESSITVIDLHPASSLVKLMCRQSAGGAVLDPVKG